MIGPWNALSALREVEFDGWRLDPVTIAADEVRMRSSPAASLTAFGIRVDGRAPLQPLSGRLNRQLERVDTGGGC